MEVIKIVFGQRTNLPRISLTKTHMLRKQIMVKVYFMTTQRFFFSKHRESSVELSLKLQELCS